MHLLATEVGTLDETATALDLEQSPADVVVLSFSDSDLAVLAIAAERDAQQGAGALPSLLPSLRLASLKKLKHPMSVDLYIARVIVGARAVIVRCLGGLDYWRYGLERIAAVAQDKGIFFAALPGDDRLDPRLAGVSTASPEALTRLDTYFREGGVENIHQALKYIGVCLGRGNAWVEPQPIGPAVGLLADGRMVALNRLNVLPHKLPVALILFYRANLMAADTAPILALMRALERQGMMPLAVAVTSLKDPAACEALRPFIARSQPAIILNTTAFSALREDDTTILDAADVPVFQVVLAGTSREAWNNASRGLSPSDLAMNVVLPELDGRILTRAISFKSETQHHAGLEFAGLCHAPDLDRIDFVARQASAWVRLGGKARAERRVAIVLSDYPARGGRTGYAVGLDTTESVVEIVSALSAEGYEAGGDAVTAIDVEALLSGNAATLKIPIAVYETWLKALPETLQSEIADAWGKPADDPSVSGDAFTFPILRAGNIMVLLQPDRGAKQDRKSGYHDTALPPRHAYVALYAHLREQEKIDALIHLGTHGTLEWLPGKALALSADCWPEAVLGPLPVIYPFIVNNPGEAAQAKRRLSAVAIGHLTPPLSAAGLHGAMADLEALVEEYVAADGLDLRRMGLLESAIVDRAWTTGLATEGGLVKGEAARTAIAKLDARLCDIKDLAVRDRLHVFGRSPDPRAQGMLSSAIVAMHDAETREAQQGRIATLLASCGAHEQAALIAALDGRRVAPGPSGAPSRGRVDVLPTGRNLTTLDPRAIPTRTAALIGVRAADEVIRRYLQDHGEYPRALVMDLWASASLRTGGDDLAQALHYLGVRPVWDLTSNRVTGIEVLPSAKLDRPRIDVTLRISGLFRDLFESQIALFDMAVRRVAALRDEDADNPLAAARRRGEDLARVFGGAPGHYGAGVAAVALDTTWGTRHDLGEAYLAGTTHAYGADTTPAQDLFRERIAAADALVHPQDDRERDVLDGDGVADYAGGFAAAAALLGRDPMLYHLDTSRPAAPKARRLDEEIARVVRGRIANPRWIAGMLTHGHRGVAEIAQGVDALYAFAATTEAVSGHGFDLVHEALIADEAVLVAMIDRNMKATACIARRLQDALRRGLWVSRRNATAHELEQAVARSASPACILVEAGL